MELLEHTVIVPSQITKVSIFPFACVHKDNSGHSNEHWQEYLHDVQSTPYAVALGLGDYYDWLRTHARDYLDGYAADGRGSKRQHSLQRLDDWRRDKAQEFADGLSPIKEKLALLSLGNHHHRFLDGTNDVQEMCRFLNVPYGGHGGYLRLRVCLPGRPAHMILKILYHHGERIGGGSTLGGDINAMARKAQGWDFDGLIVAHNHQKHGTHLPVVGVSDKGALRLIERPKAFIRAGCFMRGYVEGCVTYAEADGLKNPTAIGHVRWDILPKRRHSDGAVRWDFKTYY